MRTTTLAIALAFLCASSAQAQDTKSVANATAKEHSCMMMGDSVSDVLGLNAEQYEQVKASNARCMKACAKSEANPTGKMNAAAMSVHDKEMKKILTVDQYAKWSPMCNMCKMEKAAEQKKQY